MRVARHDSGWTVAALCGVVAALVCAAGSSRVPLAWAQLACECDAELKCPGSLLQSFEGGASDMASEAARATWALTCSGDQVATNQCSWACSQALQLQYGQLGGCACMSSDAFDLLSRQSTTLLGTNPIAVLNACFGDRCAFSSPPAASASASASASAGPGSASASASVSSVSSVSDFPGLP